MPRKVMLYALSTCGHCRNAKRYLDDNGVDYDVVYVDQSSGEQRTALVNEVKKYNANLTFPTLVIGDRVIVGFHEGSIKEALGL